MRHTLTRLLLSLAVLLLCVQQVSARAVLQPENRVGGSAGGFALPDGDESPGMPGGIRDAAAGGYDFASDVCVGPNLYAYVRQNPWSKFDPQGLESCLIGCPWDSRYNLSNSEFRAGFNKGVKEGLVVGTAVTVGVVATVYTGGLAGPAAVALLGEGTAATMTTAIVSGSAGGVTANTTANAMTGKPAMQGAGKAALVGGAAGAFGQVIGDFVVAFRAGYEGASGAVQAGAQIESTAATTKQVTESWTNPITAKPGQTQVIDPASVKAGQQTALSEGRIATQSELIATGTPRAGSPPQVNTNGVIVDGHHHLRAASDVGTDVKVNIVNIPIKSATDQSVKDLPTYP